MEGHLGAVKERFGLSVDKGMVVLGVDLNQDGDKSMTLTVSLDEAFEEVFQRKDQGKLKFSHDIEGTSLVVKLDTDGDGEPVVVLRVKLLELIAEGRKLVG